MNFYRKHTIYEYKFNTFGNLIQYGILKIGIQRYDPFIELALNFEVFKSAELVMCTQREHRNTLENFVFDVKSCTLKSTE